MRHTKWTYSGFPFQVSKRLVYGTVLLIAAITVLLIVLG